MKTNSKRGLYKKMKNSNYFSMSNTIERNKQFAKLTNISQSLITLDSLLSAMEGDILTILYKHETKEPIQFSSEDWKKIDNCKKIRNFLNEVKLKFNLIPGMFVPQLKNENILYIEKEIQSFTDILNDIK